MPRAKGGPKTRRRHKRQLKLASGFVGGRKLYRQARSTLEKGLTYAYRDRKAKKRDYRTLWIARINALARESGMSYSALIERAQEGGRRGRSQDAREARAGARRIVYRAGAHRDQRARLKSSIEPSVRKRRAPGDHVGHRPRGFLFFFSVSMQHCEPVRCAGKSTMKEQLEEIRRRAMAELVRRRQRSANRRGARARARTLRRADGNHARDARGPQRRASRDRPAHQSDQARSRSAHRVSEREAQRPSR